MIKLVDCTLRDGGHINKSRFGYDCIKKIIKNLIDSNVDIIELGFLKNDTYDKDVAVFNDIKQAYNMIDFPIKNSELCLMAQEDQYDIEKLEPCNGIISHIRVSFHEYDFNEGIEFARKVIEKGYKTHVNPINLQGYSDKEILKIVDVINELNPFALTIVDTFGAMTEKDLNRIFSIIDNNLNSNINIGLHLHENLGLSFSLAQFFTRIKPPKRDISIDASLNGIGRIPGNLNLELIMDYMNRIYNKNYDINPVYDMIDDYILPIKNKIDIPWGYSLPYALSAKHGVHRTYAEFLISKTKLKTKDIQNILANIDNEHKARYNESYIKGLYLDYLSKNIDDTAYLAQLKKELSKKEILLVAPGKTIEQMNSQLLNFIEKNKPIVISTNFSSEEFHIKPDYIFCTNMQRYELLERKENLIITSNLIEDVSDASYILNFRNLIPSNSESVDNALIMLLQMIELLEIKEVNLAGFDGFVKNEKNYCENKYSSSYDSIATVYQENDIVKRILKKYFSDIKIKTLTPSCYIEEYDFV